MPSPSVDTPSPEEKSALELIGETGSAGPKNRIGRYDLIQKLGSGEMGNVYRARQWGIDREVVIKILPRRLVEDEDYLDRFYREAKAAGQLQHINVVKAIDVGQSESGHHYFVMEYVEGKTIQEILEFVDTFEERRAVRIIIQAVQALAHAHVRGLFHGEVRPDNIHLQKNEVVKLAGLGLAKEMVDHSARRTRSQLEASRYVSPEEVKGEAKDIRSDMFALGATLYHMVTGHAPFDGECAVEILAGRLTRNLESPQKYNASLSDGFCHILERMLARQPEDRYQDPQDLLDELHRFLEGSPLLIERLDPARSCVDRLEQKPPTRSVSPAERRGPTTTISRRIPSRSHRSRSKTTRATLSHSHSHKAKQARAKRAASLFVLGLGVGLALISSLVGVYFYLH